MRRIHSVRHALRELDQIPDDSVKHAVLGGHGSGSTLHWGPGNTCGESHLCVSTYWSNSNNFLSKLSRKMHKHSSIFLDSCLSATTDRSLKTAGMNMAQWVAKEVGKGIRVFGSTRSFSEVKVQRFKAWHGVIDVEDEDAAQRIITADGGRCPRWARSRTPDHEGDCLCPDGQTCRTSDGEECPHSKGRTSDTFFLPMCAESWSKVSCSCQD
jgi:hypothetical protein